MCGRSRMSLAHEAFCKATGVPRERWKDADAWNPKFNLSPGGWIPVLKLSDADGKPEVQTMRWGLIPSFTKPGEKLDFWRMFNARSEGLTTSPVFRRLLPGKRCVVLLNGFYEWKADAGGRKQPYYVYLKRSSTGGAATPASPSSHKPAGAAGGSGGDGEEVLMAVAGLYDVVPHGGEGGGPLATVTLVTTDSCKELGWLHDRMPVLLRDAAAIRAWLGGELPTAEALAPCPPSPAGSAAAGGIAGHASSTPSEPGTATQDGALGGEGGRVESKAGSAEGGVGVKAEAMGDEGATGTPTRAEGGTAHGAGGHEAGGRDTCAGAELVASQGSGKAAGVPQGGGAGGGDVSRLVVQVCTPYSTSPPTHSKAEAGAGVGAGGEVGGGSTGGGGDKSIKEEGGVSVGAARLAWHPVTPDMTKPGFDGPAACRDVRAAKGTISSFFAPKPKAAAAPSTQQQPRPMGAAGGGSSTQGTAWNSDVCGGAGGDTRGGKGTEGLAAGPAGTGGADGGEGPAHKRPRV